MMEPPQLGKVLRAPSLKRGKSDEINRFQLEYVMGVTVTSNSALACDSNTGLVAYPSGCTIVLYNSRTGRQQTHIVNTCRKTITSLAFSSDGRYLVTGECGHMPFVRIWDLHDPNTPGTQVAEFQGHQNAVNCVAFSPSNKYVVSVGSQHDMIVNVWDWKSNVKVASNKVSAKVKAVAFAENGSFFVTVGNRHVKFWYLEYSRNTKYKEAVPLVGRAAILGSQRAQNFVAVACGKGEAADNAYAVTKSGLLCQLNNRRLLDKWLELRTTSANCMSVGENLIFVGCADGIVRCFDPVNLHFITTLPRTHHLGVDVSLGRDISHMSKHPNNAKYPDTVALTYDELNNKVTCIYNDHSIYVWDIRDVKRVGKSQSYLYHSACIWGIEMYPSREEISQYRSPGDDILPEGSFVTCSSDDTIRIWNISNDGTPRNIYSNDLIKVIYIDPELTYIKDQDLTLTGSNDKIEASYDGKNGVRCIKIRPDGLHLASGDRAGNIRIHDMRTMKEIFKIEAHDAEVLYLEYSKNIPDETDFPRLLASASRDRLIHIFNVDNGYQILQTLDDHSSSITAVRFVNTAQQLKMISCGADKSIIFRYLSSVPGVPGLSFQRGHNVAGRTTLYDMEVDTTGRHILTACQDRAVRIYTVRSGRYVRSMKGSPSDDGSLIKVALDSAGRYMATSCTDKTLAVYCAWTGQLLACVSGHSELATGLRFLRNGERLASASGDAGILLWKHTQRKPLTVTTNIEIDNEKFEPVTPEIFDTNANQESNDYRFSVGPLPLWAKKQINEEPVPQLNFSKPVDFPKGRWAQRVEQGGITVKSVYDSDSVIPFPNPQDIQDSDGSKESSIDSGTESRNFSDYRKDTIIKTKQTENVESVMNTESLTEIHADSNKSQTFSTIHNSTATRIRTSHHTDDSSLGSMLGSSAVGGDTGDSAAEHDGDVEDCSDAELRQNSNSTTIKNYPATPVSIDSPSEYTVNAISVEELRKSQRKNKTKKLELPLISLSTTSVSGSQESDFDDDDASTPSGDNADKNPNSLLTASSESLDKIGQRTKYLQSTFDSLSGVEQEVNSISKTSLSARHLITRTTNSPSIPIRNVEMVNETKQIKTDNETVKKREELTRRIQETRRKLQSVGYKSNLKSSQSICDLSHIADKESRIPSKRHTLVGDNENNEHQINSTNHNHINKNDFNIPANINIKNNFKTLPFFTRVYDPSGGISDLLYSTVINKFNEEMQNLVLQTNDTDNVFPNSPSTDVMNNLNLPEKQTLDIGSANQNRPKQLGLGFGARNNSIFKMHKSLPVSPVTEETKLSDYAYNQSNDYVTSNLDLRSNSVAYGNEENVRAISNKKRMSYSFYVDFGQIDTNVDDKDNPIDDDEANFSSDSLEEVSISSNRNKKFSKTARRCYSNYDICGDKNLATPEDAFNDLPRSSSVLLKRVVSQSQESINNQNNAEFDACEYSRKTFNRSKNYWQQWLDNGENPHEKDKHLSDSRESVLNQTDYNVYGSRESELDAEDGYNIYPEYERHSSASFYLRQNVHNSNSQESILSNFSDSADNSWKGEEGFGVYSKELKSNFNSLESILSDESAETKSAPLEILFETHRRRKKSESDCDLIRKKSDSCSQTTEQKQGIEYRDSKDEFRQKISIFEPEHKLVTRSKSFQESRKKNIAFVIGDVGIHKAKTIEKKTKEPEKQYNDPGPSREMLSKNLQMVFDRNKSIDMKLKERTDDIPTLRSKNNQYDKINEFWGNNMVAKSKSCSFEVMLDSDIKNKSNVPVKHSISKNKERKVASENIEPYDFTTKSLDRGRLSAGNPNNSSCIKNIDINKPVFTTQSLDRNNTNSSMASKFRRDFGFEALIGDVVKHKPPKGIRRSASARVKNKKTQENIDERRNSDSFHQYHKTESAEKRIPFAVKQSTNDNSNTSQQPYTSEDIGDIKSIEIIYKEPSAKTGICEDFMPTKFLNHNIEYRDPNIAEKESDASPDNCIVVKDYCQLDNKFNFNPWPEKRINNDAKEMNIENMSYLSNEDITKFREIEKKIQIINKLVEIEEAKINRGKVKRLSKNFERLASQQKKEMEKYAKCSIKRNFSMPSFLQRNLSLSTEQSTESYENRNKESFKKVKPTWPPATRCPPIIKTPFKVNDFKNKLSVHKPIQPVIEKRTRSQNVKGLNLRTPVPPDVDLENSLRRACSLSDLTDPSPSKHKNSPAKPIKPTHSGRFNQSPSSQKYNSKPHIMTRSSSVGILNQSESDSEMGNNGMPKPAVRSSLMRPTISSQNKIAGSNKSAASRRRGIQSSYSTVNLSSVGQGDSSSDEQNETNKGTNGTTRVRSISIDHTANGAWSNIQRRNKDITNTKTRANKSSGLSEPNQSIDVSTSQVSSQLCNQIAEQLTKTADNVVHLYKRLALNEGSPESQSPQDSAENSHMMKNLESAILETQKILQLGMQQKQKMCPDGEMSADVTNHNQTVDQLRELVNHNATGENMVWMMQQYSDILLNIMQERMQSKN